MKMKVTIRMQYMLVTSLSVSSLSSMRALRLLNESEA